MPRGPCGPTSGVSAPCCDILRELPDRDGTLPTPFDPTDPHFWIRLEHLARYQFAVDFLSQYGPERVADVACGTGYGLLELQAAADSVVGVDNDPGMLRRYRQRLGRRAAHLQQIDLNRERLTAASGQEALTPS